MLLVSKGSCIFNLTLGYDLTKSQKYHSFQEWGEQRMPPKSSDFKNHHPFFLSHTHWVVSPHVLKHTVQNAIVGMKGGHLKKGLRYFSHALSKKRDIFLIFFFFFLARPTMTCDLEHPGSTEASLLLCKLTPRGLHASLSIPHTQSNIGLHLPAFLASWHWPQLQRLPLGPLNGLCKQAGWF